MLGREMGMEEVDLGAPSLFPIRVEEHQGYLGDEEGLHVGAQMAL